MANDFAYRQELAAKAKKYHETAFNITEKAKKERRDLTRAEMEDFTGLCEKRDAVREEIEVIDVEALYGRGSRQPDEATRESVRARLGKQPATSARGEIFPTFGEQLRSIVEAARPGGRVDEKLYKVEQLASGMNEGVGSEGGFRIEPTFAAELQRHIFDNAEIASRCRDFPLGQNSNGIKIPIVDETSRATGSRLGGIRVYRTAEAGQITASKPALGQLDIKLEKLAGLCYATDELLSDSATLGAFLDQGFSEELSFTLDDEILNGNGAGQCLGLMNSPALVTVTKKATQAAATVVVENVTSMFSRLPRRSRKTAVWLVNPEVEWQLPLMTIGTQPVYVQAGTVAAAQDYGLLLGRPVIPCEQCAALGTKGDIVLANLQEYVLIKRDPKADTSMHVRFVYDEMAFRVTWRVNGAPLWKSALTPYKGSNAVSPYVTLETRS